jgi:hypothetical protein
MRTNPSPARPGASPASRQQHLAVVRERAFKLVLGASILAFGAVAATGLASHGNLLASSSGSIQTGDRDERYVKIITSGESSRQAHVRTRSS